jgi:NAD(P)-dependent dehydrogenase (short-subunit alcohol dehydrogenase family)
LEGNPGNDHVGRAKHAAAPSPQSPSRASGESKMTRLADKVIVVVGGTTGLGLSAAKEFVKQGGKVVVVGRKAESAGAALTVLGSNALIFVGDASNPATSIDAIDLAVRQFGKLDGLYHVAGGSGRRHGDGPLHEITDAAWEFTLDLNLTTLFYSNRAAVRQFLKQGSGGSVLNMGSVLGFAPSPRFFSTHAYAAAKSAAIGLTKSSAAYYASSNIRFNMLVPALVETPMSERAVSDPAIMAFIKTKQPLDGGRFGVPGELDGAATFFMSEESRFATGQVLAIDGGWSISDGQIGAEI